MISTRTRIIIIMGSMGGAWAVLVRLSTVWWVWRQPRSVELSSNSAAAATARTVFELYVINLSSSLSLNIIGTFKEMVTIAVAVGVFGDTVTSLNLVGVLVTVLGILAYNLQRLRGRRRREEGNGVAAAYTPMVHEQEAEAEGDDEKEEASRGGAAPSSASPHGPQRSRP
jgi:hypothetical protein